jgi:hypothetical protein
MMTPRLQVIRHTLLIRFRLRMPQRCRHRFRLRLTGCMSTWSSPRGRCIVQVRRADLFSRERIHRW